jgi:hypothetical protein
MTDRPPIFGGLPGRSSASVGSRSSRHVRSSSRVAACSLPRQAACPDKPLAPAVPPPEGFQFCCRRGGRDGIRDARIHPSNNQAINQSINRSTERSAAPSWRNNSAVRSVASPRSLAPGREYGGTMVRGDGGSASVRERVEEKRRQRLFAGASVPPPSPPPCRVRVCPYSRSRDRKDATHGFPQARIRAIASFHRRAGRRVPVVLLANDLRSGAHAGAGKRRACRVREEEGANETGPDPNERHKATLPYRGPPRRGKPVCH